MALNLNAEPKFYPGRKVEAEPHFTGGFFLLNEQEPYCLYLILKGMGIPARQEKMHGSKSKKWKAVIVDVSDKEFADRILWGFVEWQQAPKH